MRSIRKNAIVLIFVLATTFRVAAQDTIRNSNIALQDSIIDKTNDKAYKLDYRHLIAPTIFIGYGIVSLESDGLKQLNFSTRDELGEHQPKHITLDNYTQYAPAALVYGLNAAGIKGKHNFRDRTIIYATSQLISAAFVLPLKHIVKKNDRTAPITFPFRQGIPPPHFLLLNLCSGNIRTLIFG